MVVLPLVYKFVKQGIEMKKYFIITAIILLGGFGFYQKIYIPKHTFETIKALKGDMTLRIHGVGNVGAKEIYKVGSVYGGRVFSFNIDEGDFIKKGDLIAKIDSIDLSDKVAEQEANVKKLLRDIKALKLDRKSALTTFNYQEEIFKKNRELFKKKVISELDFKKFKTNRDVAKLQVSSISAKIESLHSQTEQINANTSGLKERLLRYTIYSPVDGYVTKKLISNFAIITQNQNLLEIVTPKDVWIETHIDTRMSGSVKIGDIATIELRSSSHKHKAKVTNIRPVNNSVTNEREIDVAFETLPIPFYLKEQAIVTISVQEFTDIIKVPLSALSVYKQEDGVWILKENRVHFKALKILAYGEDYVATKDISRDDNLVIPSPKKKSLVNGMKIYND